MLASRRTSWRGTASAWLFHWPCAPTEVDPPDEAPSSRRRGFALLCAPSGNRPRNKLAKTQKNLTVRLIAGGAHGIWHFLSSPAGCLERPAHRRRSRLYPRVVL